MAGVEEGLEEPLEVGVMGVIGVVAIDRVTLPELTDEPDVTVEGGDVTINELWELVGEGDFIAVELLLRRRFVKDRLGFISCGSLLVIIVLPTELLVVVGTSPSPILEAAVKESPHFLVSIFIFSARLASKNR